MRSVRSRLLLRSLALLTVFAGASRAVAQTTFYWAGAEGATWDFTAGRFSTAIFSGSPTTWVNGGIFFAQSGTVTVGSGISASGLSLGSLGSTNTFNSNTLTLTGAASVSTTFASSTAIFNTVLAGSAGATFGGPGLIKLAGANTFTGGATINSGTVVVSNSSGLGAGGVTLASGAAVSLLIDSTISGLSVGNTITAATGTGAVTIGSTSGVNFSVFSGPLILNRATTLSDGGAAGQRTTFNGAISGTVGTLTITGNRVSLGAANTFVGNVVIANGGTLQLSSGGSTQVLPLTADVNTSASGILQIVGNTTIGSLSGGTGSFAQITGTTSAATLTVGANDLNSTFAGVLRDNGNALSLEKSGTGTLTLSGANTFTGGTTLSLGTLALGSSGALGSTGAISFGGGTLQYGAANTTDYTPRFSNAAGQAYRIDTNGQAVTFGTALTSSGGSLVKLGAGTLTLGGANTYTGGTTVSAGVLALGAAGALADTGALTVTGGTFNLGANHSDTVGAVTLTGGSIAGSGTSALTGSSFALQSGSVSAILAGAGAVTKTTPGTVTLSGVNTYTGGTTISAGTLEVSAFDVFPHGGTLTVDGGTFSILGGNTRETAGAVTLISGTLQMVQPGASRLTSNTSFDVRSGTITTDLYGSAALVKSTAGTVIFDNFNAFTGGSTLLAGALEFPSTYATTSSLGTGVLSVQGGALRFTHSGGFQTFNSLITLAADLNIFVSSSQTSIGTISETGGSHGFIKTGAGTLALPPTSTFTGPIVVSEGTIYFRTPEGLGANPAVFNPAQLSLADGTTLLANNLSGGALILDHANSGITLTGGNAYIEAAQYSSPTFLGLTIALPITGPGSLNLARNTAFDNLTVLSGVNTYAGSTTFGNANYTSHLNLAGGSAIPDSSAVSIFGAASIVTLTNASETLGSLEGVGTVDLGTNTLTTGGNNGSTTYSGVITGTGGLVKSGTGTFTLSGANDYSGATTVSAGALNLQHATALGTTDAGTTVSSGGALELQGGIAIGAEALTLRGAGVTASPHGALRNVSGANSYAGAITLGSAATIASDAGTLTLGAGGITGAAQALTFDGAGDTVVQGIIGTTSGTLTKNGAGLLTLSGANSYTGLTTLNAGTLRLSGGSAIGDTGAVVLANTAGATLDLNGTSETIGSLAGGGTTGGNVTLGAGTLTTGGANTSTAFAGVLSGTGGLTKTGTGTFTLSGANTYSGATTISAGALNLQHASALGTTAAGTSVAAGGALELQGGVAIGAEALALNGTGVSGNGALRNISGANSYAGAITLGSASTITSTTGTLTLGAGGISGAAQALIVDGAGNTSITGAIATGSGSLTKTGTGTLFLTGSTANTFTGTTTISGGTVTLAKDNNVAAVSGPVSILAGGRLDYAGFNQLTASGSGITLDGGTLDIQGAGYRGFAPSLDFRAGTILTTGGGVGTQLNLSADSPGAFTVRGGLSVPLTLALTGATSTSGLTYDATGNGGLTTMSGAIVLADAGTTFTIQDSTAPIDLSISGQILEVFGARQLIKTGAGTLELTAANTLSNGADLKAGGLALGHNNALGSGALVIEGGSLQATGAARTIANPATLAADFTFTGSPALTLSGDATLTGTRAITTASGSTATFGGAIGDGGSAFGLTKLGAGTLVLSGTNTYSGTTTVSAGTLTLSGPQGGGSGVTVRGPLVIGSAGTVRVTTGSQITDTAPITINGGTLFIDNAIEGHTTGGLTLTGGQLTAAGTGIFHLVNGLATNAAATTALVSAPLNIFPSTTFTVAAGTAPGGIDLSITGAISQVGTSPLVKNGAGTLQLTGTNTYSGGTAINGGTLRISADANLGAAGGVVSFAGSTLRTDSSFTTARAATFSSGGTFDTAGGTTLTWQGGIAGTGALTKTGAGTLAVSGALTYASGTAINQGTLQLSAGAALPTSGALTLANVAGTALVLSGSQTIGSLAGGGTTGGNVTLSSGTFTTGGTNASTTFAGTLAGPGALVKTGTGAFTLAGTNTGFSGGTTLAAGSLIARNSSAFGTGAVVLNDAATAFYLDSTVGGWQLPNAITVAAGTAPATIGSTSGGNFSVFTGPIALNRPTTLNDGGDSGQRTTFNGVISGNVGTLAITGNRVTFGAANTFTGNVGVGAGATLQLSTSGNQILPLTASVDVAAAGKLTFVTTTAIGGLSGAAGSFVQVADGTPAATLTVGALNTNTVFAGTLQNGTGAAITSLAKTGTGTLTLSGANTYSGGTTLNNGALAVSTDANLGGAGGAVVFSGGTLQATAGFTAARATTLNAGGGTFDVANGQTLTWNGAITGASGNTLTKIGAGTLLLGGNNTYSGDTVVNVGTLKLGTATALSPNTKLAVASGATFDANGFTPTFSDIVGNGTIDVGALGLTVGTSGTSSFSGTLGGAGGFTMNGTGTLTLGNANSFQGSTNISLGTVKLGAAGALPVNAPVNLSSGGALDLNGNGATISSLTGSTGTTVALNGAASLVVAQATNTTFGGALTGNGGLTKSGTGTLTLTGTNTFSGATSITGGQIKLNGSAASSAFTLGGGGTLSGNATVGALTIGNTGILSPGNSPGTVTAGNSTFAGGGVFQFEVNDATGPAGTAHDLLSIDGTLTFTATSADRFSVGVISLGLDNTAGLAANFDSAANYSFTFVTTTGGITGFAADAFAIGTTAFTNPFSGTWSVALTNGGRDLSLNYAAPSAVPEPSTYAAILGACALAAAAWRKRRPAGQTHRAA